MKRSTLLAIMLAFGLAVFCFARTITSYNIDTVAGSFQLGDGGLATEALLDDPFSVAAAADGTVYVSDKYNNRLRKITPDGKIETQGQIMGAAVAVGADGAVYAGVRGAVLFIEAGGEPQLLAGNYEPGYSGDGGPALQAKVGSVYGLAVADDGTVYMSDTNADAVRKVTPDGIIHLVAGIPYNSGFSGDGGSATEARLDKPWELALDPAGNLYIADSSNFRIRKVSPEGIITTVAGNGGNGDPQIGSLALDSPLTNTMGLSVGPAGEPYFTQPNSHQVVRISPDGILHLVAGTGEHGFSGDSGPAELAQLGAPSGVSMNSAGEVFIADSSNHRVRKVNLDGTIDTIAGRDHFGGDGGAAIAAILSEPDSVAVDRRGELYIADAVNNRIRKVTPEGLISTVAGTGVSGFSGDGGPAVAADLARPRNITASADGSVYVSTRYRVRRIGPDGIIDTVAGTGEPGDTGDGGPATEATLRGISGLALDPLGNLYISACNDNRIRVVTPDGEINNYAGTAERGYAGDGGPATESRFDCPGALAASSDGKLFVADRYNKAVRVITSDGAIATYAGGHHGAWGTLLGNIASESEMPFTRGLALDLHGNLFLSTDAPTDPGSLGGQIYRVTTNGRISVIAGHQPEGFGGDGGPAILAQFSWPYSLAADRSGRVYVADIRNHRIRRLTPIALSVASLEILDGNDQSGTIGLLPKSPLVLRVEDDSGKPVPNVLVKFDTLVGSVEFAQDHAVTGDDGIVRQSFVWGKWPGNIVISARVEGLPPVEFHLTSSQDPTVTPPEITGGIFGAAWSAPLVRAISPGGLAEVYGQWFAPGGTFRLVNSGDMVNGKLPTMLNDVCVLVDGISAYPLFVRDTQVRIQVPVLTDVGIAEVRVIRNCGQTDEVTSAAVEVPVKPATPEFFHWWGGNATGVFPIAAVNPITGKRVGVPGLPEGLETAPAKPGDIVDLYATGFGETNPFFPPGTLPDGLAETVLPPQVTIEGVPLTEENVLYCGVTQWSGVYILRIRIPAGTTSGKREVRIQLGDEISPAGPFLAIAN